MRVPRHKAEPHLQGIFSSSFGNLIIRKIEKISEREKKREEEEIGKERNFVGKKEPKFTLLVIVSNFLSNLNVTFGINNDLLSSIDADNLGIAIGLKCVRQKRGGGFLEKEVEKKRGSRRQEKRGDRHLKIGWTKNS